MLNKNNPQNSQPSEAKAVFSLVEDPNTKLVSFKINRKSDSKVLFDTSFGGFIFLDQFIQISTKLNNPVYGFGGRLYFLIN